MSNKDGHHHQPQPPAPLMMQNGGGASMMMQQQQQQQMMYPAGYQLPPSAYPSAPPTPGLPPMSAAPTPMHPHTPMYAPPSTPMNMGYASGSSTPVHPNARSPARTRKAAHGIATVAGWQSQYGHLSAPGTPGPGSTAGSVMSCMTALTGMNDDAMSVVSTVEGGNLVELQPVVSQQTENIDPAQTHAMMQAAADAANALLGPPEQRLKAATVLDEIFKHVSPERLKDCLQLVIFKVLAAICTPGSLQQQPKLNSKLFGILYSLSSQDRSTREAIVFIGNQAIGFTTILQHTFSAVMDKKSEHMFIRALGFLTNLIRDEGSEYFRYIASVLRDDDNAFSYLFTMMINKQFPTSVEFVCRMLRFGNRRKYRGRINGAKVQRLLAGVSEMEGVLTRYIRKNDRSTIHNVLCITELLVRNDSATPSEQEDAIQQQFIEQNIFAYLEPCIRDNRDNMRIVDTCLKVYANLASSKHVTDAVAHEMARAMVQHCLPITLTKIQSAVIHTLVAVSRNRPDLLRTIVCSHGFNYACHLINSYANQGCLQNEKNATFMELIGNALDLCISTLRLDADSPEGYAQLWAANGEKTEMISFLFKPEFCPALLNILVCGGATEKTRAVQVMVAALQQPFPADRFRPLLLQAYDSLRDRHENVSMALFNALNDAVSAAPSLPFVRSGVDLLALLVEEDHHRTCLITTARASASHFPLNVLFSPAIIEHTNSNENMIRKLLFVCKQLVKEPELQQTWAQYREQFHRLSICGIYQISNEAEEILNSLGTEGENDFAILMAHTFMS